MFMTINRGTVHTHLRAWREHAGLTQEQVALRLGISNNVLSQKERGHRPVQPQELTEMAEIYGCEPWMLLAGRPGDPKLEVIKRVMAIANRMSPRQTASWLDIGETLTNA